MKPLIPILFLLVMSYSTNLARAQNSVRLDLEQTGAPISKYIYGQFIEHLGHSVYGGIWAEMIEDRKFCFPISDTYEPYTTRTDPQWGTGPYKILTGSPWKTIGPPGLVTMDKEHPFVGEHSLVMAIPGSGAETGISQEGLAIVKGRKYVGRIVLAGEGEVTPIVVQLALPNGQLVTHSITEVTAEYKVYPLEFTAPVSADNVRLEIISNAAGIVRIGAVSLMPADNIKGFRPEVLALLKELNSPIYRWPGGNFVSGYDFRDGLGTDPDKRAPKRNPAWAGIEHNDVGVHEFMTLLELLNAEPYIALNMGLGSVDEALKEVEYFIGGPETEMGKLRAQNGHPQPWNVRYWAVGNEMYGQWQRGHMPQDQYIKKQNEAAERIWKLDPKAQLVAVGEVGAWTEGMLRGSASHMSLLAEHIYCKLNPDPVAHAMQLKTEVKRVADAHRAYRLQIEPIRDKRIPVAMDEWNYWYGDYLYGDLGCQYRHKDGLGVAMALHEFFRNSDLFFMANYAQSVNVLGAIKASKTEAAFETTGLVLKLYRNQFGTIPISVPSKPQALDVSAAWTEDRKTITLGVVNCSRDSQSFGLEIAGTFVPKGNIQSWTIAHSDMEAHNEPGKPDVVKIEERTEPVSRPLSVPAQSIVLFRISS